MTEARDVLTPVTLPPKSYAARLLWLEAVASAESKA